MRVATVGKGGSGKTTIAGTLSRILAKSGGKVLAIDGDPNPNLALMLGMTRDAADAITYIPPGIMQAIQQPGEQARLAMTVSEGELLSTYAAPAPDGIDLIVMGKPADGSAGSGCMCASHRAVRGLISEMSGYGEHSVTDMEAGLEHLKRGTARNVNVMLIVAEPYYRSLEAAARIFSLARELAIPELWVVANKVRSTADREGVETFCRQHTMPIIGVVPEDAALMEAERRALAPIDFAPDCAAVSAIREIAAKLTAH